METSCADISTFMCTLEALSCPPATIEQEQEQEQLDMDSMPPYDAYTAAHMFPIVINNDNGSWLPLLVCNDTPQLPMAMAEDTLITKVTHHHRHHKRQHSWKQHNNGTSTPITNKPNPNLPMSMNENVLKSNSDVCIKQQLVTFDPCGWLCCDVNDTWNVPLDSKNNNMITLYHVLRNPSIGVVFANILTSDCKHNLMCTCMHLYALLMHEIFWTDLERVKFAKTRRRKGSRTWLGCFVAHHRRDSVYIERHMKNRSIAECDMADSSKLEWSAHMLDIGIKRAKEDEDMHMLHKQTGTIPPPLRSFPSPLHILQKHKVINLIKQQKKKKMNRSSLQQQQQQQQITTFMFPLQRTRIQYSSSSSSHDVDTMQVNCKRARVHC